MSTSLRGSNMDQKDSDFLSLLWYVFLFFVAMFLLTALFNAAGESGEKVRQQCLDRGGYPISKGPRSYDYHCFKRDPLLGDKE